MNNKYSRSSCVCAQIAFALVFSFFGCSEHSKKTVELRYFPVDNMAGIITRSNVTIDTTVSCDGKGSLRITAPESTLVRLFETGDVDIENAPLIYQAKVRTEGEEGNVYLEMWCSFLGRGEFVSRGITTPITGTTDWTTLETPFFLKKGQNPDNVRLNLVITGKGIVWIDDVRLIGGWLGF